jgi:hypothetical protein
MTSYDLITDEINTLLKVNPDWNEIPGGLTKVSSSSLGFSWGISSGKVYYCRLPCTGEWKQVDIPNNAIDISTDDTYVYVLTNTSLLSKTASNMEDWVEINVPSNSLQLFNSLSYIWIQDSLNNKWRLSKPGTTANWVQIPDTSGTIITHASGTSLYGIKSNEAMKSDESLQSGWTSISEFADTKLSKVFGDSDKLYGIDLENNLKRCIFGNCSSMDVPNTPQNLNVNNGSLWLTTTIQGLKGNIYSKYDSLQIPDTSELDRQRDRIVDKIEVNNEKNSLNSILLKVSEFLKSLIKSKPENLKHLQSNILKIDQQNNFYEKVLPGLLKILFYLGIVSLLYLFFGWMDWITHIIALIILGYGIYSFYI